MDKNGQKFDVFTRIKSFIEQKDLRFEILDDETIIVPYEIAGRFFKPNISIKGSWIVVSCLIVKNKDLPSHVNAYLLDLCKNLLVSIHELPEINFDMDRENNIYASADMRSEITDYNNFVSEFMAIPYAVKYFIEKIAPSMEPKIIVKGETDG